MPCLWWQMDWQEEWALRRAGGGLSLTWCCLALGASGPGVQGVLQAYSILLRCLEVFRVLSAAAASLSLLLAPPKCRGAASALLQPVTALPHAVSCDRGLRRQKSRLELQGAH